MKKNIFNIFKSNTKSVRSKVKKSLLAHFPDAINIDWTVTDDSFEAIFYVEEIEHIAKLSKDGLLLEYKKNLWLDEVPDWVSSKAAEHGEMMSAIIIFSGKKIKYEIIIRKKDFNRFLLIFDNLGNLLKYKPVENPASANF
jgi:hypothetical protein